MIGFSKGSQEKHGEVIGFSKGSQEKHGEVLFFGTVSRVLCYVGHGIRGGDSKSGRSLSRRLFGSLD